MEKLVVVGISEFKIEKAPCVLVTYALGSCVAICVFDSYKKIGGLSHIMLPNSKECLQSQFNRMKYADTAIFDMIKKLKCLNCKNLKAKIVGGSEMFKANNTTTNLTLKNNILGVGVRNVEAVKKALNSFSIPVVGQDIFKNYGRTAYLYIEDGTVKVKSAIHGEKFI